MKNQKSSGQDTLKTEKSLSERADEMLLQERLDDAEKLYKRLVSSLEGSLGPQHCEVATAMHKLAAVLVGQGKEEEARATEERANLIMAAHKVK